MSLVIKYPPPPKIFASAKLLVFCLHLRNYEHVIQSENRSQLILTPVLRLSCALLCAVPQSYTATSLLETAQRRYWVVPKIHLIHVFLKYQAYSTSPGILIRELLSSQPFVE